MLCNITHQSTLQRGKVVSIMFPTFSFNFQSINKSVCLIYFPSCFDSSILKLLFFIHLIIIFLFKSCLQLITFVKFSLCSCKLFKCNSLTSFLDLEEFELWLDNFWLIVIVRHSCTPNTQTLKIWVWFLCNCWIECKSSIW